MGWEGYTPPHKRVRGYYTHHPMEGRKGSQETHACIGLCDLCSLRVKALGDWYYALPILAGAELVGHVDPKADRDARALRVVSRRVRRGHKVAPTIRELAAFLNLRNG